MSKDNLRAEMIAMCNESLNPVIPWDGDWSEEVNDLMNTLEYRMNALNITESSVKLEYVEETVEELAMELFGNRYVK